MNGKVMIWVSVPISIRTQVGGEKERFECVMVQFSPSSEALVPATLLEVAAVALLRWQPHVHHISTSSRNLVVSL